MNFGENIKKIRHQTKKAQLVVVTKNQSIQNIKNIYQIGERNFGENKVQDLLKKNNNYQMILTGT